MYFASISPIIRFILITALRDLLFAGLCVISVIAVCVAFFLGSTALIEQDHMIISYIAGSMRFILVTGLILFVCFHVRRSFDNKEIEVILSRPISRLSFVIAYWVGFLLIALIIAIPLFVMMAFITPINPLGMGYWATSIVLEAFIIITFALVSALILKSAVTSALSSLGFYLISRMMGFFVSSIVTPSFSALLDKPSISFQLISELLLKCISMFLPRLDLFGKTSWLIYGPTAQDILWVFPLQSLIYIPLLLTVAIVDFSRKQF